jgi:hypothetical protein
MARYNSKRLATASFGVAGLALLAIAVFGWHEFKRWSLQSQWGAMQVQVTQLDAVQARIRDFAPWYDTNFRTLSILRRLTECFPDNGSVTAKSFEVHGTAMPTVVNVSVSGTARDNDSLLRVQKLLGTAKEVQGLKIEQIRGKTPMQFTLTFRWNAPSGT